MAKKELGLKLKYKSKFLSYVTEKKDFGKSFVIGSDANLFWQILDDKFPKNHVLVSKQGEGFLLHLRPGMNLTVNRGDQVLTPEQLKSSNLLHGNDVPRNEDPRATSGDWEIEYAFATPYSHEPTQAERALIAQFTRRPPASAEQKFTNIFMLLAFLVTIIGIIVFKSVQPAPGPQRSLVDIYKERELAQMANIEQPMPEQQGPMQQQEGEGANVAEQRAASAAQAGQAVATGQQVSAAMISGDLGFNFDPNAVPTGGIGGGGVSADAVLQVNQAMTITSSGGGGRAAGANEAVAMFNARAAGGSQAMQSGGNVQIARERIGVGGGGGNLQAVDINQVAGSGGSYQTVQLTSNAQFQSIRAARYGGITPVKQEQLDVLPPTDPQRTEYANIKTYISTYQKQIENAFRVESALVDMHGSLEITLLIASGGKVDGVELKSAPGSYFSPSFLQKVDGICKAWKIPVSKNTIYGWRMQFIK